MTDWIADQALRLVALLLALNGSLLAIVIFKILIGRVVFLLGLFLSFRPGEDVQFQYDYEIEAIVRVR